MKHINNLLGGAFLALLLFTACEKNGPIKEEFAQWFVASNANTSQPVTIQSVLRFIDLSSGVESRKWTLHPDSAVFVPPRGSSDETLGIETGDDLVAVKVLKPGKISVRLDVVLLGDVKKDTTYFIEVKDTVVTKVKVLDFSSVKEGPKKDQEIDATTPLIEMEAGESMTFTSVGTGEPDAFEWSLIAFLPTEEVDGDGKPKFDLSLVEEGKEKDFKVTFKREGFYTMLHRSRRATPWTQWDTLRFAVPMVKVIASSKPLAVIGAKDTEKDNIEVSFNRELASAGTESNYIVEIEENAGAGDFRAVDVESSELKGGDASTVILEIKQVVSNTQAIRLSFQNQGNAIVGVDNSVVQEVTGLLVAPYIVNFAANFDPDANTQHPWFNPSATDGRANIMEITDEDAFTGEKSYKVTGKGDMKSSVISFQIPASAYATEGIENQKFTFSMMIKTLAGNSKANLSVRFNGDDGRKLELGWWASDYSEYSEWKIFKNSEIKLLPAEAGTDLVIQFVAYGPPTSNHNMLIDDFTVKVDEVTTWE